MLTNMYTNSQKAKNIFFNLVRKSWNIGLFQINLLGFIQRTLSRKMLGLVITLTYVSITEWSSSSGRKIKFAPLWFTHLAPFFIFYTTNTIVDLVISRVNSYYIEDSRHLNLCTCSLNLNSNKTCFSGSSNVFTFCIVRLAAFESFNKTVPVPGKVLLLF